MTRKISLRIGGLLATAVLVAACSPGTEGTTSVPETSTSVVDTTTSSTSSPSTTTTAAPNGDIADTVYVGGDVVTMDPSVGIAEALAVQGARIVAVGPRSEVEGYIGDSTQVIDLGGRTLAPGFVDPHSHALSDAGPFGEAQQRVLSQGITTIADASVEPQLHGEFVALAEADEIDVRLLMYVTITDPCGELYGDWWKVLDPGPITDRLALAGVKVFGDGSFVCGAVAASEPWAPGAAIGPPFHATSELADLMTEADALGLQMIVHAQGDLAIDQVLDAYEMALEDSTSGLRHRIDHNSFLTPESARRYSDIGVVPVVFGGSPACADLEWTDFMKQYGDRPNTVWTEAPDTVVAWHSDDPYWPPEGAIPDLYSLVTRNTIGDDGVACSPEPWMETGAVTIGQAMQMMTINAAYALGLDDEIGSLSVGKRADLLVLSGNPLSTPHQHMLGISVEATIIDGVAVFCGPSAPVPCPDQTSAGEGTSASASRAGHGPTLAFDGVATGESFWSSGEDAPGWVRLDFEAPTTLSEIRLVVFQNPASDTVHQIEALVDGEWELMHEFRSFTATGDVLTWQPSDPVTMSAFRVTTLESASWPEWYEIEYDVVE